MEIIDFGVKEGFLREVNGNRSGNTFLASHYGDVLPLSVEGKVATLEDRVEALQDDQERVQAESARLRVIHFNGELLRDVKHTSEEFDQVLTDIDTYEDYCDDHPKYPNNKAILAVENIKRVYANCLKEHDFL